MEKAKATPEWKRLITRCQKLWEAYDKAPTKKRLETFGAHLEKMKASKSVRVKAERTRGARAFRAEWKRQGYKSPVAKKKAAKKATRRKNPPAGSPLRREWAREQKEGGVPGRGESQWPDYRTVVIMLGTKEDRKAFTKVAKELMKLGFAIDYEYEGRWKDGSEWRDAQGRIDIQSRSLPLPWKRMQETWDTVFVGWERAPWMDAYDDEYRGPDDPSAAAEELLEKHGGKIPLTYGSVEMRNPKRKATKKKDKRKAAKRKSNPAVHYPEGWKPSLGRKWAKAASRDEIEARLEQVRAELADESMEFSMYRVHLMGDETVLEEALKRFPHPSRREPKAVSGEFEANPKKKSKKRAPGTLARGKSRQTDFQRARRPYLPGEKALIESLKAEMMKLDPDERAGFWSDYAGGELKYFREGALFTPEM